MIRQRPYTGQPNDDCPRVSGASRQLGGDLERTGTAGVVLVLLVMVAAGERRPRVVRSCGQQVVWETFACVALESWDELRVSAVVFAHGSAGAAAVRVEKQTRLNSIPFGVSELGFQQPAVTPCCHLPALSRTHSLSAGRRSAGHQHW